MNKPAFLFFTLLSLNLTSCDQYKAETGQNRQPQLISKDTQRIVGTEDAQPAFDKSRFIIELSLENKLRPVTNTSVANGTFLANCFETFSSDFVIGTISCIGNPELSMDLQASFLKQYCAYDNGKTKAPSSEINLKGCDTLYSVSIFQFEPSLQVKFVKK